MTPEQLQKLIQDTIAASMASVKNNIGTLKTSVEEVRKLSRSSQENAAESEARKRSIAEEMQQRSDIDFREELKDRFDAEGLDSTEAELDDIFSKMFEKSGSLNQEMKIKPDDLPKFNGNDVHKFLRACEAATTMFSLDMVAKTIPRKFEDQAQMWWMTLPENYRFSLLGNFSGLCRALEEEFKDVDGVLKDRARERKWKLSQESVSDYFYDKQQLLIAAYGSHLSEKDVCYKIKHGLPNDFQLFIRTPLGARASVSAMRKELQEFEGSYLESKRKMPATPATSRSNSPNSARSPSSPSNPSEGTTFRRSQSTPPLRESYNPNKISSAPGPDGKLLRSYTLPTGQVILLNRPCRFCKMNHFDFEHDYMENKKNQTQRAKSVPAFAWGYPIAESAESEEAYPEAAEMEQEYPLIDEPEDNSLSHFHQQGLIEGYPTSSNESQSYFAVRGSSFRPPGSKK